MNKIVIISLTALTLLSLGSCKKAEESVPEAAMPQKEFKKAFPTAALPYKWGVSIIQVFYFKRSVFCFNKICFNYLNSCFN